MHTHSLPLPSAGVSNYQETVSDAVKSAHSALGLLGLDQPSRSEQEVTYDLRSDSDHSTPPGSSDNSEEEYDPLLDFSYQNEALGHSSSAVMVGNVIKAQQALNEMKKITESIKKQPRPQVSTEASLEIGPTSDLPPQTDDRTGTIDSSSSPPPIPDYNPSSPDNFLLSNKPEYKLEIKRQRHTYEDVSLDDPPVNPVPVPPRNRSKPPPTRPKPSKSASVDNGPHAPSNNTSTSLDPIRASKGLPSSGELPCVRVLYPSLYHT